MHPSNIRNYLLLIFLSIIITFSYAQPENLQWSRDGSSFTTIEENELVLYQLPANGRKVVASKAQLTPRGMRDPLTIELYTFSEDNRKLLLYTNTQRVWRINTRGDYWVLDLTNYELKKIGQNQPGASLMFAKFSPDGTKVAYVSQSNLYVEYLSTGESKQLTTDGTRKFINGTFDWVYEEEFGCRDGFRWSTDSKSLAYWQIDARETKDFYMINNTDSVYSHIIPVEYPKVGQNPSACRIGVVNIATGKTEWMKVTGDPRQHYIVRMEFIPGTNKLIIQQLNRKQNESKLMVCQADSGIVTEIWAEKDDAWVDVFIPSDSEIAYNVDFKHPVYWLSNRKEFLWLSEKDGWRHLFRISVEGKNEKLITSGDYDVINMQTIDEKGGFVYFTASPGAATQKYLYRVRLDGKGKPERVTPAGQEGTHSYNISPNGKFALHTFTNLYTFPVGELISLPQHRPLNVKESIQQKLPHAQKVRSTEFFKVTTEDGVEMDGWIMKPKNFSPSNKYPVVFYVYTEPAAQTVTDSFGADYNFLYEGDMAEDGYIYISLDNRGTPAPKGSAWRKSIYRKVGIINIRDQAMAAKKILEWSFVDTERIAVWGWSGGASATLNLMFQYPEIYKTGIAIAPVTNQLTYDNIYQERYMGLPQENREDFIKGSPVTYAKNLVGNLLIMHGTGDDNVHYQNTEILINELVKHNKQFQLMIYPNRSHDISEGEGTFEHITQLYTRFLHSHCPPGAK